MEGNNFKSNYPKQYKTVLKGSVRKGVELYRAQIGENEAQTIRELITFGLIYKGLIKPTITRSQQ